MNANKRKVVLYWKLFSRLIEIILAELEKSNMFNVYVCVCGGGGIAIDG